MKVVPKSARMTVITSDSKYSRGVDFLKVASAICLARANPHALLDCLLLPGPNSFEGFPRGGLLGRFLRQTDPPSYGFVVNDNFHRKQFLMIGPFLAGDHVFGAPPQFHHRDRFLLEQPRAHPPAALVSSGRPSFPHLSPVASSCPNGLAP